MTSKSLRTRLEKLEARVGKKPRASAAPGPSPGPRAVPPNAEFIPPRAVYEKFSRRKSWLWDRVANAPTFPKPVYLGPNAPAFVKAEVDAYAAELVKRRG